MPKFLCSAILFDLDGVLVRSKPVVDRQWRIWAAEQGLDPEQVLQIAHGRRTIETLQHVAPHLDAEAETLKMEQREVADTDGLSLIPGAAELLAQIPPECWAVATSGTRELATMRLRHVGLPLPRVMIAADDVVEGKPAPEPYLKAAAALSVSARDCVVIEDAPAGVRSGHAAQARVIAVLGTFPPEELASADAVIPRLSDLQLSLVNAPGGVQLELILPGA